MSVIEFEAEKALFAREVFDRIHKAQKEIEEGKGIAGDEVMRRLSEKISNKTQEEIPKI